MISVQSLQKKDIPAYRRLLREVIRGVPRYPLYAQKVDYAGYSPKTLAERSRRKDQVFLTAKEGKEIVGLVFGGSYGGVFWLEWIGVAKKYQKRGVGKLLVQQVTAILEKKSIHKIWLNIDQGNIPSEKLFQSLGYRFIARIDRHWHDLNCTLWEKIIKSGRNKR